MSTASKSNRTTSRDENWITVPGLFSIQSSAAKPNAPSFVYVIGVIDTPELVKIGVTRNVAFRLAELQTASPFRLELRAKKSFQTKREAFRYERTMHSLFRECRTSGEWFRVEPEAFDQLMQTFMPEAL